MTASKSIIFSIPSREQSEGCDTEQKREISLNLGYKILQRKLLSGRETEVRFGLRGGHTRKDMARKMVYNDQALQNHFASKFLVNVAILHSTEKTIIWKQ